MWMRVSPFMGALAAIENKEKESLAAPAASYHLVLMDLAMPGIGVTDNKHTLPTLDLDPLLHASEWA